MKRLSGSILLIIVTIIFFGIGAKSVLAYKIEDLNMPAGGDFVLGPGKTELWVEPGEKHTMELLITNRVGEDRFFEINVEDFKGSYEPRKGVIFLGEEKGPYSLKDYLNPEITEFTLSHGQRIRIPVEISIPEDAEPGGLYGSILVSASIPGELDGSKQEVEGQMKIVTRLASLFFIRVKGDVFEEGFLKEFYSPKNFYEKGPISLTILYENSGNIHLLPYGKVEIRNTFGKKIEDIELDPWFVMPASLRLREIKLEDRFFVGRYTATLLVNRGYGDIIEEETINFWVIPWKILIVLFLGLVVIIWFFIWVASHFEIKKKKEPDEIPL